MKNTFETRSSRLNSLTLHAIVDNMHGLLDLEKNDTDEMLENSVKRWELM